MDKQSPKLPSPGELMLIIATCLWKHASWKCLTSVFRLPLYLTCCFQQRRQTIPTLKKFCLRFEAVSLPISNMERLQPLLQRWLKDSISEAGESEHKMNILKHWTGENCCRILRFWVSPCSPLSWSWLPGGKETEAPSSSRRKCSPCSRKSISSQPNARDKRGKVI